MSQIDDLIAKLCPNGVDFRAIGDFGELVRGNGMPKADFVESGVGCIHYGQIYTYYGIWTAKTKSFIPAEKAEKLAKVDPGDLVITNTSENIEDVCKAVAWIGETQIVTGGHATVLKHDQDPKYLSYYLQTPHFFAEKKKHATGTKVIDVSAKSLAKIRIPVPPLEVQREIVKVLDTFTQLEAELEARRRQYKYYRDALLMYCLVAPETLRVVMPTTVGTMEVPPLEDPRQFRKGEEPCPTRPLINGGSSITLHGPITSISYHELEGRGWAVGALLRPAGAGALCSPSLIQDSHQPLEDPDLSAAVAGVMIDTNTTTGGQRAASALADWMAQRTGPPQAMALIANKMEDVVAADRRHCCLIETP